MKVKYQIFVSSTFEDLKPERELVIKAILEIGHIPVGMEMFSAGNDEQWKIIQKQIDDCDYYIVISAHKYGSMHDGISYTEKEYDYASSIGIPTLGFIINDSSSWPSIYSESDSIKIDKLKKFKEKIKNKLVNFWINKEDLYAKVSISLMKHFIDNPRVGWIKADQAASPDVLKELARLSKENALLRELNEKKEIQLNFLNSESKDSIVNTLENHKVAIGFRYDDSIAWEEVDDYNFLQLFNILAPALMSEITTQEAASYIARIIKSNTNRKLVSSFPIPINVVKNILSDLVVIDLIKLSVKRRTLKDKNDYWTITEEGKMAFKAIRKKIIKSHGKYS
ncbi:hypothetical protein BWI97_07055 [Siphonobacter sp. BAB-5405]|uniref:DUF4062 domain-containing protein n=1 Tax=Siphonobacter sp. BAB-5405 TaxID=1864825 RepID=UPI000C7FB9DF|nr:DUF4062 domain-containing protein [Siphonobacter sp. BAB-5405]PMD97381.1 hypothetical protein BWI97_07055 [Siphonobacter sp. BAB-5405]